MKRETYRNPILYEINLNMGPTNLVSKSCVYKIIKRENSQNQM